MATTVTEGKAFASTSETDNIGAALKAGYVVANAAPMLSLCAARTRSTAGVEVAVHRGIGKVLLCWWRDPACKRGRR